MWTTHFRILPGASLQAFRMETGLCNQSYAGHSHVSFVLSGCGPCMTGWTCAPATPFLQLWLFLRYPRLLAFSQYLGTAAPVHFTLGSQQKCVL